MKKIYSLFLVCAIACLMNTYVDAQGVNSISSSIASKKTVIKGPISAGRTKITNWIANQDNMPGNLKAFQENKGQFLNLLNDWKIAYGANCQETEVLFTNKGLIYYIPQTVEMTEAEADEWEKGKGEKEKELEAQHEKHYKTVYQKIAIEWENANPNPIIDAVDETPFYFGSVNPAPAAVFKSVDNIKGFRKLVYHDVYPGVDVEFTFHPSTGIKYAIKVKPGYDVSFKMKYSGQDGLLLDADGNVHIKTVLGDMIDHAPVTKQNGNTIPSSFKQLSPDEMTFEYSSTDKSSELVIDPWLVSPVLGGYVPADCSMDAANNVYVLEWLSGKMYVQKYTSGGLLSWTYSCTQYGTQSSISDMVADPSGNTYTPQPYFFSNGHGGSYAMLSLNSAGIVNYFYNLYASSNIFETWGTGYSCYTGEVIESGSPTVTVEQVGIVTAATGILTGPIYQNPAISELYASTVASNGNLYCISSNLCFCTSGAQAFTNNVVAFNISGITAVPIWNTKIPNYNFADFSTKNPAGIPDNGIGTSCQYVYTSDGKTLYQFDINTGANLANVTIPGGSNALPHVNSGVAVDPITGFVYVGSQSTVEVYTSALSHDTTYSVPGIVYDLAFNNGVLSAVGATAGNVGFVEQFNGQKPAAPPIIINAVSASCGRNDGQANVLAPGFCTGPYTYLWSPSGQTTDTAKNLSAGTYTVTVGTTTNCVTVTDSVTIGQSPGFGLTLTPVGINCSTGNITTTVTGGSSPYTYNWSNGATTANITGVAPGKYFVSVRDSSGCLDTASAVIPSGGPTATIAGSNPTCVTTGTATVTATGGTAPYTYSWSSGATTSTATGLTAGTYTVTVTDNTGCKYVQIVTLNLPVPPTIEIVPVKDSICSGLTTVLTASGGKTYTWNPGALTGPIVNVSPLATTTYTVVGTDSNGCTGKDSVTVKVLPAPSISVTPPVDSVCKGSTVALTVSGGKKYIWTSASGLNCDTCPTVLATPSVTTTWKVVGTGANGCKDSSTITVKVLPVPIATITVKPANDTICAGDSAMLVAGGGGTYDWTFSTKDTIWVKPATSTIYSVKVDLDGCIANASKAVIVIGATIPKVTVSKDSICPGDSTELIASGGTAYKWLVPGNPTSASIWVKPASNGTYTVVVTTPCGKDTLTTKLIHVIPFPVISTSGNTSICRGSNVTISAGGGTNYSWSTGATSTSINVSPASTKTYTVTVSNGTCLKDTTLTVTVDTPAVLTVTPPSLLCYGDSMMLTATGGPSYKWSTGATTSSIWIKPGTTTKYTCVVSKNGCIDSISTLITVDVPVLNACCPKTIMPGGADTIIASGSGNYIWTPNTTLNCSNCDTVIATPTVTTTYTVIAKDIAGCPISKEVTVFVEIPCADFTVPNIFTPNNDGRNDDFVISVLNPSTYSIIIYDRWGKEVYTSTDPTVYWNGKLLNTQYLVSDGVYYYIIKATCGSNDYVKKGFVQVVGEQ